MDRLDPLQLWHIGRLPVLIVLAIVFSFQVVRTFLSWRKQNLSNTKKSPEILPNELKTLKSITWQETVSRNLQDSGIGPVKTIKGQRPKPRNGRPQDSTTSSAEQHIQPLIFFSTLSGSTEKYAKIVSDSLSKLAQASKNQTKHPLLETKILNISDIELDDYFTAIPKGPTPFYIVLFPTYNIDSYLDNFLDHLKETHFDFRVETCPLHQVAGYAVFGFGDATGWPSEEEGFCSQAIQADKWLAKLTDRKRAYPLGLGDVRSGAQAKLDDWCAGIKRVLTDLVAGNALGEGVAGSGDAVESDEEGLEETERDNPSPKKHRKIQERSFNVDDLENLGRSLQNSDTSQPPEAPTDFTTYSKSDIPPKEMVPKSSPTHASLTKQGYTIVGSHSGVKICRWTKSALRGRGSCYKHSFYGIASHLCMESTPSLSCSNKCVFCWRHGTNPVGTTWRWQVDPPDLIFKGVKEGHYKKIKMMRGVPGVRADRFEEAMRIRHCALSLVGEPIFYPHINEFVDLLHSEQISSFLVCNAQHPDQLAALKTVTQLYVSIDASNRDSLRKIDRPLHRDFWERFCRCLDILREKRFRQRTVFRLTLVKGFNIEDEAEGYADLVARGLPCFVEVKGVTFCGTSTSASAGLTMQNVPFYEEIAEFVLALSRALEKKGLEYGIAAEHAHSCCILLASTRFCKRGRWNTVIDYGKFFELLESGNNFTPEEYMAPTEEWALWGNKGFDPRDERVKKKGRNKTISSETELASSQ